MHKRQDGERLLTEIDFARLKNLGVRQLPTELADSLDSPDIVPSSDIPPDVITMYSQVVLQDIPSGKRQQLTLCYPADADPHLGLISVLSPVGSSLLGQRVGDIVRWRTPNGDECTAEIAALPFQPESTGDYTT